MARSFAVSVCVTGAYVLLDVQCVAVCCSVLQCVAECCRVCCSVMRCVAEC